MITTFSGPFLVSKRCQGQFERDTLSLAFHASEPTQATHKDYSESVDALDRAIVILKRKSADTSQLLQKAFASKRF